MRDRSRYSTTLTFVDMLFNLLLGVVFMMLISILLINPPKKTEVPTPKRTAEYLVRIFWQHDSPADVDLWVKEPTGAVVFFGNKEGQVTHLERDDLGQTNDVDSNGKPLLWNEENTVLRGNIEGWWQVSVHNYSQKGGPNPEVKWELVRVKDNTVVASGNVKLDESSTREVGCVQFLAGKNGALLEVKQDPTVLLALTRAVGSGIGMP